MTSILTLLIITNENQTFLLIYVIRFFLILISFRLQKGGAENLWNIPNSAKDEHTEKSKPTDSTISQEKVMNTQEVMTTLDTKTSLGIYSMSAPSSAVSSSKIDGLSNPQPTTSESHSSSSATTPKEMTNEGITSPARRPILVTGIPSGNRRQMNGKWEEDTDKYDDTMPRIPITTPHSAIKKNSTDFRKNNGIIRNDVNNTNPETKGKI